MLDDDGRRRSASSPVRPIGVDPSTLLVKGTENIHVVDASVNPTPLSAYPAATIMAMTEKASETLLDQI